MESRAFVTALPKAGRVPLFCPSWVPGAARRQFILSGLQGVFETGQHAPQTDIAADGFNPARNVSETFSTV
jgi:hypothetical protein